MESVLDVECTGFDHGLDIGLREKGLFQVRDSFLACRLGRGSGYLISFNGMEKWT